jgi:hypothetical protein
MVKDNGQWDYELLAILSLYADLPMKKLKKTIAKLSKELHIDQPSKPKKISLSGPKRKPRKQSN